MKVKNLCYLLFLMAFLTNFQACRRTDSKPPVKPQLNLQNGAETLESNQFQIKGMIKKVKKE